MNAEYLILAGVWLGPVKPNMKMILKPIIQRINEINIPLHEGRNLRAKLLLGVFDLPAKAMALNCTQFNGQYGCPHCLDKGTFMLHRRLYLPNDSHKPRKMKKMLKWSKKASKKGEPIYGVKGSSVLTPHIDLVKSVPVNYMHAVLEGVTKSLFNCWFDSKHYKEKFLPWSED